MSLVRHVVIALASGTCSFALASAVSCSTDAVGVDDCRKIEEARCEAASHCEGDLQVDDVDACKRYYRDQCLHGLAVESSPGAPAVSRCVSAIQAAGNCAASDPDISAAECAEVAGALDAPGDDRIETACDVVRYPELIPECDFLSEEEAAQPAGNGGAAGATDQSQGGTSGGGTAGGGGS
jgi:hypothetical protein